MQAIIDSDTPSHSAVSLCNITAGYEHSLFQNLSLEIPHGLFAGIVGPTACGKTTLLKILMGMHPVTCGKAELNGRSVEKIKPGIIGYVPQLGSVDWNFPVTVEEVIAMGLYTNGRILPWLTKHERHQIYDLAERLDVSSCLKQHILAISGGQRQRTFLARALISNPKILILDEPTSGVDIKTQHEILHLLGSLNCEGITILLTTHDLNAVASHLPWVICFNKGVIAQGRPHDIFTNEILAKTYGGDIVIVKHEGHLLIAHATPLQFMDQP
ncbi:MAG: metal ABC transporter ATP-binding protein [Nitrosomonas sp.]